MGKKAVKEEAKNKKAEIIKALTARFHSEFDGKLKEFTIAVLAEIMEKEK